MPAPQKTAHAYSSLCSLQQGKYWVEFSILHLPNSEKCISHTLPCFCTRSQGTFVPKCTCIEEPTPSSPPASCGLTFMDPHQTVISSAPTGRCWTLFWHYAMRFRDAGVLNYDMVRPKDRCSMYRSLDHFSLICIATRVLVSAVGARPRSYLATLDWVCATRNLSYIAGLHLGAKTSRRVPAGHAAGTNAVEKPAAQCNAMIPRRLCRKPLSGGGNHACSEGKLEVRSVSCVLSPASRLGRLRMKAA